MAYVVKEADILKDKNIMLDILTKNRKRVGFDYEARYDWLYLNNPAGPARAWIIWNEKQNIPVGFTGVFPRRIYVDGKQINCWNCGDFSIEKKFRSLGVALKLRKAAKECVDSGEIPFLYAHPNERMEVIHLKSGHHKIAKMMRFALPIRVNKVLKSVLPFPWLAGPVALPINMILSLKYHFSTFLGLSSKFHNTVTCTAAHDVLAQRMAEAYPVVGVRDTQYLNWKYKAKPHQKFRQFEMFYKGTLVGTIFFTLVNNVAHVVDVLIDDYERFANQLFRLFIKGIIRTESSIASISFVLQEFNPFVEAIKNLGFKYRNDATSAAIAYANPDKQPELTEIVLNGTNWFMTVGDRDA